LPDDFLEDVEASKTECIGESTERNETVNIADHSIISHANLEKIKISTIQKILEENDGNVSATAKMLGVSRNTIYRHNATKK
jgi:transcriptional regulator of acetoin/glycerol metabolism